MTWSLAQVWPTSGSPVLDLCLFWPMRSSLSDITCLFMHLTVISGNETRWQESVNVKTIRWSFIMHLSSQFVSPPNIYTATTVSSSQTPSSYSLCFTATTQATEVLIIVLFVFRHTRRRLLCSRGAFQVPESVSNTAAWDSLITVYLSNCCNTGASTSSENKSVLLVFSAGHNLHKSVYSPTFNQAPPTLEKRSLFPVSTLHHSCDSAESTESTPSDML